jgi:hypothetical protein
MRYLLKVFYKSITDRNYSAYQNQLIDIDFDETDMSDY